jgi:hypothetical protein
MICLILGIGFFFFLIGLILTVDNSKYLLSGYNSLNEEERSKIDIKPFVKFFRRFHFFLSFSFSTIGILFYLTIDKLFSELFIVFFPFLAYIFFFAFTSYYNRNTNNKSGLIVSLVLILIVIIISIQLIIDLKIDRMIIQNDYLTLEGNYGEKIDKKDILSYNLLDSLPILSHKLNGFAMGNVKKGIFLTKSNDTVKLIIHSEKQPFIEIERKNNLKVYYNQEASETNKLFNLIENSMKSTTN